MLFFPGSKINLGLQVGPKRADGYHEIRSVFYRIPFTDILEVVPSQMASFHRSGITPGHKPEDDLVMKAMRAIPDLPPLAVHLHKIVPAGAGLGGGSADASEMLKAIKLLHPNKHMASTEAIALSLGSDCPFFLKNGAQLVTGRGELMSDHALDLSGDHLVVIHQGIHISTSAAYAALDSVPRKKQDFFVVSNTNKSQWKEKLVNDFEAVAFEQHPSLQEIKTALYKSGAYYASMTGSGSAVFGLFSKAPTRSFPGTVFSGEL